MAESDSDQLSNMPLELRAKVLSLIPTQSAVRASVLSVGWENSWRMIKSLRLDDEHPLDDIDRVACFRNKVMEALGATPLETFHLHFTRLLFSPPIMWIRDAIGRHIREMDIAVHDLELPPSFFTCGTLAKLRLWLERWSPEHWDQPEWDPELVINLPNLEYFDTCAQLSVSHNIFRIIQGSPSLKSLSLDNCGYIQSAAPLSKSLKLKRLEFNGSVDHVETIFHLLGSCPSLEQLSIGKLEEREWNGNVLAPICMVEKMKTLKFTHYGGMGSPEDELLKYVMSNAQSLTKVLITFNDDVPPQGVALARDDLEDQPKISAECKVYIL